MVLTCPPCPHNIENDKEALTRLIAAAKEGPGQFIHAAQAARELAAQITAATAKLEKAKVRILTREQARGTSRLDDLTADQDRKPITPAQHKKCPGHAAYIFDNWQGVHTVYVCTDSRKHGHHSRYGAWQDKSAPATMTEDEADALTEQAREERRRVIANNRAWASVLLTAPRWPSREGRVGGGCGGRGTAGAAGRAQAASANRSGPRRRVRLAAVRRGRP